MIDLNLFEQVSSRPDMDCAGDSFHYRCSILSYIGNISLTWRVIFPSNISVNFTHYNTTTLETLNVDVNTTLNISNSNVIVSDIILKVRRNVPLNRTLIECSIADLDSDVETLVVDTKGSKI